MKRPNPLSPNLMSPIERRAELCGLLALGVVRLKVAQDTEGMRESSLHSLADPCAHATHPELETA